MTELTVQNLLPKAKQALRVVTSAFDPEILDLIRAAAQNLETRGVTITETSGTVEPLVQRCILTYVRINFGDPADYERLKESYDEQLGQLMTTTNFTNWG